MPKIKDITAITLIAGVIIVVFIFLYFDVNDVSILKYGNGSLAVAAPKYILKGDTSACGRSDGTLRDVYM